MFVPNCLIRNIQAFQPVRHCVYVRPHALRMVKHRRSQIIRMHHELTIGMSFTLNLLRFAKHTIEMKTESSNPNNSFKH
jgi:hypothetical protein